MPHTTDMFKLHISWFSAALLSLLLLNSSLVQSILVVVILVVLVRFGRSIGQISRLGEVGIGVSAVVGIGVWVLLVQCLLSVGLNHKAAHWTSLLALLLGTLFSRNRERAVSAESNLIFANDVLTALAIAMFAFSLRHPWSLPFSVSLAVGASRPLYEHLRRTWRFAVSSLVLVGWLISLQLRPERWWYLFLGGDSGFFESLSFVVSRWSIWEHPGYLGGSMAGYHWLSFAFLGGLTQTAELPTWHAFAKLSIPIVQFCLAGLILQNPFVERSSRGLNKSWIAAAFLVVGTSVSRFDSGAFGLLCGLAVVWIAVRMRQQDRVVTRAVVLLIFMSALLMLSKTSAAALVGAMLWLGDLTDVAKRRRRLPVMGLSFLVAALVVYVLFFRDSAYADATQISEQLSLMDAVFALLVANPFGGWLLVLLALVVATKSYSSPSEIAAKLLMSHALLLAVAPIALSLAIPVNQQIVFHVGFLGYFVAGVLASVVILQRIDSASCESRRRQSNIILSGAFCLGSLLGFVYPVALNRLDARYGLSEMSGEFGWEILTDVVAFVILAFVGLATSRDLSTPLPRLLICVVVALGLLCGFQLDRSRRVATWGPGVATNWPLNDSAMSSDDLKSLGAFVRRSTSDDIVVATNDFCCFGNEWWSAISGNIDGHLDRTVPWWDPLRTSEWYKKIESEYGRPRLEQALSDTLFGGDNYLLAAEIRRRTLIQGLKWQALDRAPTDDQLNRMTLSLAFANDPEKALVSELKRYGVSGYVVNLDLTDHRDWSQFAIERFKSERYVYLELKD